MQDGQASQKMIERARSRGESKKLNRKTVASLSCRIQDNRASKNSGSTTQMAPLATAYDPF